MLRYIQVCALLSLGVLIGLAQGPSDCRAEDSPKPAESASSDGLVVEVPLVLKKVPLIVAKCFGEEHNFVFDTGCTLSVLDESFRERLGDIVFTNTMVTRAGPRQCDAYPAPDITLGGVKLIGGLMVCEDMKPFSDACGVPLAGIIGLDQIRSFVIELDLTGKKLRLFRQLPARVERDSERFEIHRRSIGWFVSGAVGGVGSEDFLIDTGSGSSIGLCIGKFDPAWGTQSIREGGQLELLTLDGRISVRDGLLRRFTLGSYEHEWIHISSERGDSLLGANYLRRYVVVFDFARKHLYLRPSPQYHATIETDDRSGLSVERRDGEFVVTECVPESPAREAGFRARDRLLRIDDEPLEDWSLNHVREYFQREGETIEITVCRGEETFTREFTLRNYRKRPPAPALPIPEHVPSR